MRTVPVPHQAAIGALLLSSLAMGQIAYPDLVIQDESWHSGVHHVAVTQKVLSPGAPAHAVDISNTADVEFVSGTQVHLAPGFHAGALGGSGRFHAYIDPGLGPPGDVVAIAPDPALYVQDHTWHVNKWEKLEIGLQLPQEYRDAIDRFFAHYYSDPVNSYIATPANVDPVHDLNPYADDSLQVVMTLTKPDGSQLLRWGFFMREARWQSTSLSAQLEEDPTDPLHPYHFRFRLAPDMEGLWQFSLSIKAPHTTTLGNAPLNDLLYTGYSFVCEPPLPDNHGPLQVNQANRRTLQFADGTAFFGLGVNMPANGYHDSLSPLQFWQDTNSYRLVRYNCEKLDQGMKALSSVGGNFVRIFQMDKGFAPENVNIGVYDRFRDGLSCGVELPITGNSQFHGWAFDRILDTARVQGIYLQACLVPYPPIIDYENFTWGGDAYLHSFVAPREANGLYNMKRYFYSLGDTTNTDSGAFYFWKRKYKYILSRWGWSVNMPILEPFNEIDQMLTYRDVDLTNTYNAICAQDKLHWLQDPALPATYSQWLTDIITFVKGEQVPNNPVYSPLGYDDKLFLAGTGPEDHDNPNWAQPANPNWNLPNRNPHVDLVDVHRYMYWGQDEMAKSFSESQAVHDAYTNSANGTKRPFHQGESNYAELVDLNPIDTITDWYDAALVFDNYDVSFHNEIWAGAFFGNFTTACSWQAQRVFWWEEKLPVPEQESNVENPYQMVHTNDSGAFNILNPDGTPVLVQNRPVFHNFKPLAGFLFNPNLQASGFFNGVIWPHKQVDDTADLEAYYLTNADSTMAIGWVHNLNAYWEKHYYVKNHPAMQDFFGCTAPGTQVSLPGLQPDMDYHITWFPTRMNDTILPETAMDTSRTGTILLDLSTAPLGDTAQLYLDTLRLDYAFIIAPQPVLRSTPQAQGEGYGWGFALYPNPAEDELNIVLSNDGRADITLADLAGRRIAQWSWLQGPHIKLSLGRVAPGAYYVRVRAGGLERVKPLIIH